MPSSQELTLVSRFHTLAKEYSTRPVVARRSTVPTLMKFMVHPDREVRLKAAETVLMLADHPENPEFLCREKGLLPLIYNCFRETETTDPDLFDIFANIFEKLRPALGAATSSVSAANAADGESARFAKNRQTRVQTSSTPMNSRTLIVRVANLEAANRSELEEILQTTRGVISYTVEPAAKTANLFLSTPTPTLKQIMEDAGYGFEIVEEIAARNTGVQPMGRAPSSYFTSGASGLSKGAADFMRSLVMPGVDGNSLTSRLQRQKEEQERKKREADSSSIRNFVSNITSGWW